MLQRCCARQAAVCCRGAASAFGPPPACLTAELSGRVAPKYARALAHSRLGRRVLRSLLGTELGDVRAGQLVCLGAWAEAFAFCLMRVC